MANGIRISSWSASMIIGSENTRVLPLPVKATPIMSLPDSTVGSPCNTNHERQCFDRSKECQCSDIHIRSVQRSYRLRLGGSTLCF